MHFSCIPKRNEKLQIIHLPIYLLIVKKLYFKEYKVVFTAYITHCYVFKSKNIYF